MIFTITMLRIIFGICLHKNAVYIYLKFKCNQKSYFYLLNLITLTESLLTFINKLMNDMR
jgi:hypothetical protein